MNIPAFPLYQNSFQGVATDAPVAGAMPLVHADADGDITVTYREGAPASFTLAKGEDVQIPGAVTVSSTMSIKVS